MGFLPNETNNIVMDCVLTDLGRQFLSRNDGSFSIIKFAAADDEVDYSIITKFGRTIGKEKIEKNVTVFEAITNQTLAQKYRLISISNPNLIRLPSLAIVGGAASTAMGRTTTRTVRMAYQQSVTNESTVDMELRDQAFEVSMNNMFLGISGGSPDVIDGNQRATYMVPADSSQTAQGGAQLTFTLELRTISDSQFTVYGNISEKTTITTYIKVTGLSSGNVVESQINISKTG